MGMRFRKSGARTHRRARTNEEYAYEGLCGLARIIFTVAAAVIIPLSLLANPLITLFFLPVGCVFAFAARRFRRNA